MMLDAVMGCVVCVDEREEREMSVKTGLCGFFAFYTIDCFFPTALITAHAKRVTVGQSKNKKKQESAAKEENCK